jgi:hypothetical protein
MSLQAETVVVLDASCSNFDPNFAGLRITFTQRTPIRSPRGQWLRNETMLGFKFSL